jgi:hypothetical protein
LGRSRVEGRAWPVSFRELLHTTSILRESAEILICGILSSGGEIQNEHSLPHNKPQMDSLPMR